MFQLGAGAEICPEPEPEPEKSKMTGSGNPAILSLEVCFDIHRGAKTGILEVMLGEAAPEPSIPIAGTRGNQWFRICIGPYSIPVVF